MFVQWSLAEWKMLTIEPLMSAVFFHCIIQTKITTTSDFVTGAIRQLGNLGLLVGSLENNPKTYSLIPGSVVKAIKRFTTN